MKNFLVVVRQNVTVISVSNRTKLKAFAAPCGIVCFTINNLDYSGEQSVSRHRESF